MVESRLIVELKALTSTATEYEAQVLNYLKATGTLNFGASRLAIKRLVLQHNDASPI